MDLNGKNVQKQVLGAPLAFTKVGKGDMYFHDATICFQNWQSCATCHPNDARMDGLNWDLLNDGMGNPKNTKTLLLSHQTPPCMATGIRKNAEVAVRSGVKYMNGKVVWNLDVPGGPHSLTRLSNGHTLIAVADKDQNPRLIEVTAEGKTVWELSNADIPGKPLKFLGGFQYFSDGRFLITNWTGHVNPKEKVHMLLVDRQKKILYSLENTPGLKTMSSVYSMDIPAGVTSYH